MHCLPRTEKRKQDKEIQISVYFTLAGARVSVDSGAMCARLLFARQALIAWSIPNTER